MVRRCQNPQETRTPGDQNPRRPEPQKTQERQKNSKYSRISQSLTSWPSGNGSSASASAYRPISERFIMIRYDTSVSPNAFR